MAVQLNRRFKMRNLLINIAGLLVCIMASNLYAEKLTVVWEKELGGDDGFSYVGHEAVCNDGILQVIGYAFDSKTRLAGKYWFCQINSDGKVISQEDFHTVSSTSPSDIIFGSWLTKGLKVDQSGLYCAGKFATKEHFFAKLGAKDKKFLKKQLPGDPNKKTGDSSEEFILKMVDLSGSKFVFVGRDAESKGLAVKTDSDGKAYCAKYLRKANCLLLSMPSKSKTI